MTEALDGTPVRLGILAGGGSLPATLQDAARRRGWPVHIVAIEGEADALVTTGRECTRVDWGQIGGMLQAFRQNDVSHLAIVGNVRRPDLTRIKPDWGLVRAIPAIWRIVKAGGDDSVLRRVIRFFEGHGFTVIGPLDIAPGLAVAAGALGLAQPDAEAQRDIAVGLQVVRVLGGFDIGQGVVVRDGQVIAIEGAEGTDAMLARVDTPETGRRGVLVKRPKPHQDMRVDVPVIGPGTARHAARAGLAGIAVLAGEVLAMQREDLASAANDLDLFVIGVTDDSPRPPVAPTPHDATDEGDMYRACAVIGALRPYRASRIVVVARKYVLAVETGEGSQAVLERVGGLRQWGAQRLKKRKGTAVFASGETVDVRHVDLAAQSGLSALATMPGAHVTASASARAAELRLSIAPAPATIEAAS